MRLVTFEHAGTVTAGVVGPGGLPGLSGPGERVYPLPHGGTVLDAVTLGLDGLLDLGSRALARPDGAVPLADVRLLAPLQPPTIRDFVAFDFELEVAAVIGRVGADLSPQQARDHIVGYTILNDWSARDLQRQEMRVGLGPAKGKDSATTLGPWLVTADELEPFRDHEGFLRLRMSVAVNGVEVGRDLLSNMGWPFEELVAHASRGTMVRPGDVLGSGTCGNGGCLAELWGRRGAQDPPPLRPGDVVTMTVEGIGTISNRVVPGRDPIPLPSARPRPRDRG
jgi:2-keto-4-pentenoate hydratase/2-oxohepta-3-ene-1,7-dioic acid hydratase in catechol pathway